MKFHISGSCKKYRLTNFYATATALEDFPCESNLTKLEPQQK